MTQEQQILRHLENGNSITPMEALGRFGCFRLGARIYDLKRAGNVIHSELVKDAATGKRWARYTLQARA